jgi:Flp pilus assembly pilin Flp
MHNKLLGGINMQKLVKWVRKEKQEISQWINSERGQNTVEYLMMLAVIVGVILVIGKMFKPQISGIFNQIMGMISGAASTVGSG